MSLYVCDLCGKVTGDKEKFEEHLPDCHRRKNRKLYRAFNKVSGPADFTRAPGQMCAYCGQQPALINNYPFDCTEEEGYQYICWTCADVLELPITERF